MNAAGVSIILVNYNGGDTVVQCLQSLKDTGMTSSYEVILVDNGSTDGSPESIRKRFRNVTLIPAQSNLGFSRGCNLGAEEAGGNYLLFLNPDTLVEHDIVAPMREYLETNASAGIVGPRLENADKTLQLSCGRLPTIMREFLDKIVYRFASRRNPLVLRILEKRFASFRDVGWVTGACLMIRADLFRSLGGFDGNLFMYFEDKDLCKRAADKGWKVVFLPSARVIHLLGRGSTDRAPSATRGIYRSSQLLYYRKHLGPFQVFLLKLYHSFTS